MGVDRAVRENAVDGPDRETMRPTDEAGTD
jgi:hypothetical protein